MRSASRSRHDVVIVGARVAGAAAPMLLACLGRDVVAVDQASFPSDQPEFVVVTHWDPVAALEAFAGPRWQQGVIEPEEKHMLAQVFCDHYETTEAGAMMASRPIR